MLKYRKATRFALRGDTQHFRILIGKQKSKKTIDLKILTGIYLYSILLFCNNLNIESSYRILIATPFKKTKAETSCVAVFGILTIRTQGHDKTKIRTKDKRQGGQKTKAKAKTNSCFKMLFCLFLKLILYCLLVVF